jgi:hypothetical protein
MPYMRNCAILSTFDVGPQGGNREDLLDIMVNISPDETPLFSGWGKTPCSAVLHEWMVDELTMPGDPDNPVVHCTPESSDADFEDLPVPCRINNQTHILRKTYDVSDTQRAVNTAGMADMYTYQVFRALRELKLLIEFALIHSTRANQQAPQYPGDCTPSPSGCRMMDGVLQAVRWNQNDFACLSAAMQGSVIDLTGSPCTMLTPQILDNLNQVMWGKGAAAKNIWVNAFQKRRISQFYLRGHTALSQSDAKKLVSAIDVYESDFGVRMINLHRWIPTTDVLMTDDDFMKIAVLRPIKAEELARVGNSTKGMVEFEGTGEWRAPAALGLITGLCNSGDLVYCDPCTVPGT